MQDKELSYVQMSRHRGEARIYAATEDVGKTLETMGEIMNRSRQKELAQEKRAEGLQIAPATSQESREEATRTKAAAPAERQQQQQQQAAPEQQAAPVESWRTSFLNEDRTNVREVVRALEQIADISGGMRRNPHNQERAKDITAWVRYGQEQAAKLGSIPSMPLDTKIKDTLTGAFKSLHSLTRTYEHGRIPGDYVVQSTNLAREAWDKVQSDLSTWELARSLSNINGNFNIVAETIQKGARIGNLQQHGDPGEHNFSVFTIRGLPGTYIAHMNGMHHTGMNFDEYVKRLAHGYGDPPDSKKVTEIEYDPIKARAAQIEEQRTQAQARRIEPNERQEINKGHDYGGFSR
jgi:hypothetical protein